jgi:myo-inositol-1-phosphate synthase
MHVQFGDYHVRDIEFVAAFDVDAKKVGLRTSPTRSSPARTTPSRSATCRRPA